MTDQITVAGNSYQRPIQIHDVRGEGIVLDHDVAKLFGVETKRLNEQVNRNKESSATTILPADQG